jgi:hypothetical protein
MGDHRGHSDDSRGSLGYVPIEKVVGRAFVIIWSPSRVRLLSRPHYDGAAETVPMLILVPGYLPAFATAAGRTRTR